MASIRFGSVWNVTDSPVSGPKRHGDGLLTAFDITRPFHSDWM